MSKSTKKYLKPEDFEPIKLWSLFKFFIISSFAAIFAFTLIYFLTNLVVLYFAYDFNIPAHFDLNGLFFDTDKTNRLWTFDATVTLLLSKSIGALLIAILSLTAFLFVKRKLISFFFFLFWMNVLSFNLALGGLVDEVIIQSDTYIVFVLLKLNFTVVVFSSLVIIYFLYRIGMINFNVVMTSFPKNYFNNRQGKLIFLSVAVVLPWLLLFTIPAFDSTSHYTVINFLKNVSVAIIILPLLIIKPKQSFSNYFETVQQPQKFDWFNLGLFTLGTFLLYYFMVDGVYL